MTQSNELVTQLGRQEAMSRFLHRLSEGRFVKTEAPPKLSWGVVGDTFQEEGPLVGYKWKLEWGPDRIPTDFEDRTRDRIRVYQKDTHLFDVVVGLDGPTHDLDWKNRFVEAVKRRGIGVAHQDEFMGPRIFTQVVQYAEQAPPPSFVIRTAQYGDRAFTRILTSRLTRPDRTAAFWWRLSLAKPSR